MTARVMLVLLLLLLVGCSSRQVLYSGYLAATCVDWKQTRYIAAHPREFYEGNKIMGRHPSKQRVDTFFAVSIVTKSLLYFAVPEKYQVGYLGLITGLSLAAVEHNYSLGVKMSF